METLVKDKIEELTNMLAKLIYLINNEVELKSYDIIVPILIIARTEIIRTIEYMNKNDDYYFNNNTIYICFINLDIDTQNNIIEYLLKDLKKGKFTQAELTKDKIINTLADEFYITDDAIDKQLEKNYLIFFVSFIISFYKSVLYNSFSEADLNEEYKESTFLKLRIKTAKQMLEPFISIVNKYTRVVNLV